MKRPRLRRVRIRQSHLLGGVRRALRVARGETRVRAKVFERDDVALTLRHLVHQTQRVFDSSARELRVRDGERELKRTLILQTDGR